MRPRFSIALLSEDSSEQTWRGLKEIVQKLLRRFEDDGYTPRVELLPADPKYRPILVANRWRSTKVRDEADKRELWKYLARKISEPGGFVIFHYDGDTTWSKRAQSPSRAQFEREVRTRVEQVLAGSKLARQEIARRMARLIECVPFYSVEAWTYQATARAVSLCREKHRGADVDKFERWGADRAALDDVMKPKEATCLRDAHNEDLAKHVAIWEVVQAGSSMTWFVWSLHASRELEDALAFPS